MKRTLLLFLLFSTFLGTYSQISKVSFTIKGGIQNVNLKHKIESNTMKLIQNLNESYSKKDQILQLDKRIITDNGIENVSHLWKSGHFFCPMGKIVENLLNKKESFQVRNIPFVFGKKDTVDVVFEYSPDDGRIKEVYIGLDIHQTTSVLKANSVIDRTRREIIQNFLESLRTSYIKKDINYIEKLYSDKALIITGKVLSSENLPTDQIKNNFTTDQVAYQVLTKSEYIERLRNVFNTIDYLRLDFKSINIIQHKKHENFYGITLRQTWDTSRYKDDGLLFLLVQFKDNNEPLIWVRTWQNALKTLPAEAFGLHNFKIPTGRIVN